MNDRAKDHLTDEQLAEWLDGSAGQAVQAHLEDCAPCRAEAHALQDGIACYATLVRRQATQAQFTRLARRAILMRRQATHAQFVRPVYFAPARWGWHRLRWAGAGLVALLLAAQTAWMMKPGPKPGKTTQAVSIPVAAVALGSPQPAASMSDDELLQAVNNDLGDEVPQALAPVGAITEARNRIASEETHKK